VDVHLAAHPVPAGQARERGAAGVRVCGPVVGPRFGPATEARRRAARLRFGPGESAPLALLVAGSWGVGEVEQAAADIQGSGGAVKVVVCGRNEALAARLREQGVAHVHGWVRDMPELMHACDVLVQNAGGLTSLEAFASGLPVASYRCIPGHGQTNAAALQEAGLAVWVRDRTTLAPALNDLLTGPTGRRQRARGLELFRTDAGPAQAIAELAGSPVFARTTRWALTTRAAATATATAAAPVGATASSRAKAEAKAGAKAGLRSHAFPDKTPAQTPAKTTAKTTAKTPTRTLAHFGRPATPTHTPTLTLTAPRALLLKAGLPAMLVVTVVTLLLGIGDPLADAYEDSAVSLGTVTHFLDGAAR